eukprot:15460231-Alexandrium_andersonii.AAC.1
MARSSSPSFCEPRRESSKCERRNRGALRSPRLGAACEPSACAPKRLWRWRACPRRISGASS